MRKFVRAAYDLSLDALTVLQDAAYSLEHRANTAFSQARLNREVRDLQDEINLQMRAAGEILYASHRGQTADQQNIDEIMEYVDGLNEEIDAHQREINTLQGLLVCPACGEPNRANCLYCQNCGQPLSRG